MTSPRDLQDLAGRPALVTALALADYPRRIGKEVIVRANRTLASAA